ncbi:MAG: hypothetical protein JWP82_1686 [Humibacillus sp.]|nr:hypothetical protein [Humibacillus sp.]
MARALVLALVASAAATTGHALGDGHVVSGPALLAVSGLLAALALPLVGGRLSGTGAVALLGLLQAAAHVLHTAAAGSAPAPGRGASATPSGHGSHGGHGHTSPEVVDGLVLLEALTPSPAMVVAHLGAAVVVGLLLTRGEQSWWVAVALLAAGLVTVVRLLCGGASRESLLVAAARRRQPLTAAADLALPPADVWTRAVPARRGPPGSLST